MSIEDAYNFLRIHDRLTTSGLLSAAQLGGLRGEGYGRALGRFVYEDGATFPARDLLAKLLADEPGHERSGARADLLAAM